MEGHTLRNSQLIPTMKFEVQLTHAAIEFAPPRAPESKSSETKNHGIEPINRWDPHLSTDINIGSYICTACINFITSNSHTTD